MNLTISSNGVSFNSNAETIEEAMAEAAEWVSYTGSNLYIFDGDVLVAMSHWWGVEYDSEEDYEEPVADFGQSGYYASWTTDDFALEGYECVA